MNIVDVFLIAGIFQGIFLVFTIPKIKTKNPLSYQYLLSLLIIGTIMLLGRLLVFKYLTLFMFEYSLLFDVIIFLFGPIFYYYIKSFLYHDPQLRYRYRHFVIPGLFILMCVFVFLNYSPSEYFDLHKKGDLKIFFNIIVGLAICTNFFYLILSIFHLKLIHKKQEQELSWHQPTYKFIRYFVISISIVLISWLFGYINSLFLSINYFLLSYDVIWIIVPLIIYLIAYFHIYRPELFNTQKFSEKTVSKIRLSDDEIVFLKDSLDVLMKEKKLFEKSDLSLSDVAKKLNRSNNDISWLLNNEYNISFYDYINKFRIEEVIEMIQRKEYRTKTLLALSMDAGFNSKSTFNKSFKSHTNLTPSEYIKSVQSKKGV